MKVYKYSQGFQCNQTPAVFFVSFSMCQPSIGKRAILPQIFSSEHVFLFSLFYFKTIAALETKKKICKLKNIVNMQQIITSDFLTPTYLPDLQCWHMWKKVIANKKAQKDKIINNPFKVDLEWRVGNLHIILQILS